MITYHYCAKFIGACDSEVSKDGVVRVPFHIETNDEYLELKTLIRRQLGIGDWEITLTSLSKLGEFI